MHVLPKFELLASSEREHVSSLLFSLDAAYSTVSFLVQDIVDWYVSSLRRNRRASKLKCRNPPRPIPRHLFPRNYRYENSFLFSISARVDLTSTAGAY